MSSVDFRNKSYLSLGTHTVLQSQRRSLGSIVAKLQKDLFTSFRVVGRELQQSTATHSSTARLAFVCATVALMQRMVARMPHFSTWLNRNPLFETTALTVPPLYDYYLLLSEALLRRKIDERVT